MGWNQNKNISEIKKRGMKRDKIAVCVREGGRERERTTCMNNEKHGEKYRL